jgi:hypothetical protein
MANRLLAQRRLSILLQLGAATDASVRHGDIEAAQLRDAGISGEPQGSSAPSS